MSAFMGKLRSLENFWDCALAAQFSSIPEGFAVEKLFLPCI
jgi:hypothetical protein